MIHNVAKRTVQVPSEMWWVIATAISPLLDMISITFTKIQARNIVISQQRQEMLKLVANIVAGLDIRPATDEALEGVDPLTIITRSDWFILKDSVVMHIQDQGSWVRDLYNALSDIDKQTTLKEITIFGISIVANVSQVQAKRDSNNNVRELEAPMLCPWISSKFAPSHSSKTCWIHIALISRNIGLNIISMTWRKNIDSCVRYTITSRMSQRHSISMTKTHFLTMRGMLSRGDSVVYANFVVDWRQCFPIWRLLKSLVKWEKNNTHTSLTSLTLVGIMQAKQFELLKALFKCQNTANDGGNP
ncbi:unnamed protein product [Sphagnum jensenii]|uniref:Uncharacterized protein n=1 Tax=Sphagnum jensenii TaxID=128206 RepID=A0ABP1AKM5_9BRYO